MSTRREEVEQCQQLTERPMLTVDIITTVHTKGDYTSSCQQSTRLVMSTLNSSEYWMLPADGTFYVNNCCCQQIQRAIIAALLTMF